MLALAVSSAFIPATVSAELCTPCLSTGDSGYFVFYNNVANLEDVLVRAPSNNEVITGLKQLISDPTKFAFIRIQHAKYDVLRTSDPKDVVEIELAAWAYQRKDETASLTPTLLSASRKVWTKRKDPCNCDRRQLVDGETALEHLAAECFVLEKLKKATEMKQAQGQFYKIYYKLQGRQKEAQRSNPCYGG
ncbi:hypothetical protein [Enhygromyxa salina]|uniref:hypothetical protein n=1 Tax=Enhygromyxa salina TaxID=215803 RepID=UPI000D035590|nr:hypothetical protein [Enhygromyxa salina]